jgi:ribosomal protein S18 acetylase RimI-like enzyme
VVVHMRDAVVSDYDAFVRLFAELKVPDPTPTQVEFAARIVPQAFFCIEAGEPLAYGFWRRHGEVAHVVHIVVAPEHRGRSLGHAVMHEIATRARASACIKWYLNVKKDNAVALALYERCGLRVAFESFLFELAWADVIRLPAARDLRAFEVDPALDHGIETDFALAHGQLANLRNLPGRVLLALREQERFIGFAAFDPEFPGASPFRVARPEYALPLLEAMRRSARIFHSFVYLAVENDGELAAALRAAGARAHHELLRMNGELAAAPPLVGDHGLRE